MQTYKGKTPENALSPSGLNLLARNTIETHISRVWVLGEITDLYQAASGHAYFSLKDNKSSIKCTFFKQYNFKKTKLQNGDQLLIFGTATLYEERGTFQIKVERVESTGIGEMTLAFQKLKVDLEAQGYFDESNKKPLPKLVSNLAIVTSKTSAAIRDVLNVIKRRNPLLEIHIYHSSVQGEKAVEEIIDSLLLADINQHDVILLTRGGGSEEDLWTFNDVSIAQTIFNLNTPIVSAIGHERDSSISDLVADTYAITPTAAAEMLTPDLGALKQTLNSNFKFLYKSLIDRLNNESQKIDLKLSRLEKSHPKNSIDLKKVKLDTINKQLSQCIIKYFESKSNQFNASKSQLVHSQFSLDLLQSKLQNYSQKLENHLSHQIEIKRHHFQNLTSKINTLSPLSTLSRGYSITFKQTNNQVISCSSQVVHGDMIETQTANGRFSSQVVKVNKNLK
jgi:exodeoxyribonuclease VII large subunit